MHGSPAVSLVMPAYNAELYVAEAIGSILAQTFPDFEFIIINDGSTDGTRTILDTFAARDSRVSIYEQDNSGLVVSLNRGCQMARGKYIARMDADDVSLPTRLAKQFDYLERNPDVGIVGTWFQDMGPDGKLGPMWLLPTSPATIKWYLMFGNCMAHPTVMARREVMQSLRYRQAAGQVEDYDLWIRAASVTNLANIPETLLQYRVTAHSFSGRNFTVQQHQSAMLKCAMMSELANREISKPEVEALRISAEGGHLRDSGDVRAALDLLLSLYGAYRRKVVPTRGDDAEITLDVFRRVYLLARSGGAAFSIRLWSVWFRLPGLIPRLCSFQALRKAARLGVWSIRNARYGWTTQRRM